MTDVYLEHNPYSGKTLCKVNEKLIDLEKCWGEKDQTSSLQDWVGRFFEELHKKINDEKYNVTFFGVPSDCQDMKIACDFFCNGKPERVTLELREGRSSENRIKELRKLFETLQNDSPYEELKTKEIRKGFERALSSIEEIGVVATMSSGKSTLINAMLGQELLPARNEATTAIVAKIYNDDTQSVFSVKAWGYDGTLIEDNAQASLDIMEKLNSNKDLAVIELKGDVPNIDNKGIEVVLSDTPGPNNSVTDEHKQHTYNLLNSDYKPMILYVFNATQLRTNDDNTLLSAVAEKINMPGTQSKDRFLFVLNKADALDPGKGESVSKAIEDLRGYLQEHNIKDPQIFPVSAQLSKVIRMKKNGHSLSDDEEDFLDSKVKRTVKDENRHFSAFAPLSSSGKTRQEQLIQQVKIAEDNEGLADVYSGVPAVEIAINEYVEKYAISAKVKKAVESFDHVIDKMELRGNSIKNLEKNKAEREEVVKALGIIEQNLKNGEKGQEYRKKIDELTIKDILNTKIKQVRLELMQFFSKAKSNDNQIEIEKAERLIGELKRRLDDYAPKLKSDIEKAIQDTVIDTANKIINDYTAYVKELVDVGSFKHEDIALSVMLTESINVDNLIDEFTEEKKEVVGTRQVKNEDKKWYKFWTWFQPSYYTENVYANKKFVNYQQLHDSVIGDMLEQFDTNVVDTADNISSEEVKRFKEFFKNELQRLDEKMASEVQRQKDMLGDEAKFKKEVEKETERLKWIQDFNEKLKSVLKI